MILFYLEYKIASDNIRIFGKLFGDLRSGSLRKACPNNLH